MKNNEIGFFFLLIIVLAACSTTNTENSVQSPDAGNLNFENASYQESQFGSCDTTGGVSIQIRYLEPGANEDGEPEKTGQNVSTFIRSSMVHLINSYTDSTYLQATPKASTHIPEAFEAFARNYRQFKSEFPESLGCWTIELNGDTVMTTPKIVVYQLDQYSFTGGAHPNTYTGFYIFDKNGRPKQLTSFIKDTTQLLERAEVAFRELEKVPDRASLQEVGYFLPGNQFFLPANMAFTREGVLFLYNPYEIAAYARGPIQFIIPYSRLTDIIHQDLIF
ncbi:DUF3298 and DUF4163 domain-containing protein [Telluribacter sp.]|jgi:hypothetical protein|uniref:DUF3298 and DUF4163 domain-containing protein n=1 Tax=Telluribacter sp. TaxID=1978767 RepID=UPI002E11ADC0|nr:DUF3298 domain-containing protein [Telluribacter sp.]